MTRAELCLMGNAFMQILSQRHHGQARIRRLVQQAIRMSLLLCKFFWSGAKKIKKQKWKFSITCRQFLTHGREQNLMSCQTLSGKRRLLPLVVAGFPLHQAVIQKNKTKTNNRPDTVRTHLGLDSVFFRPREFTALNSCSAARRWMKGKQK